MTDVAWPEVTIDGLEVCSAIEVRRQCLLQQREQLGGFNARLITPVIGRLKSAGGLIAGVMVTAFGFNIVAGDQYIAIVLPARMFMVEFRKLGLHPETLATAVENSGTVTSPLIPWNSCGAYMSAALGVSTYVYLPYCFFNFANFLLGMIYGFVGINVMRLEPEKPTPAEPLLEVPFGRTGSMMSMELSGEAFNRPLTDDLELLECLRKIGKGLIASGTAVGVVENTLTEIALIYHMNCEILALPNVLMIKLGKSTLGKVDFVVQQLTTLQLDQVSNDLTASYNCASLNSASSYSINNWLL